MTVIEHSPDSSHHTSFTGEPENTGEEHSRLPEMRIFWDRQQGAESRDEERERPPVGKLLRDLRGDRTLRQVEADTGIANSYLSNLESGLKRPGVRTLAKLSRYYRVPVVDLLEAVGIQASLDYQDISPDQLNDVQRSYEFVMADPLFSQIHIPDTMTPKQYQQLIVEMYQVYTGKRLL